MLKGALKYKLKKNIPLCKEGAVFEYDPVSTCFRAGECVLPFSSVTDDTEFFDPMTPIYTDEDIIYYLNREFKVVSEKFDFQIHSGIAGAGNLFYNKEDADSLAQKIKELIWKK